MNILEVKNLKKIYGKDGAMTEALSNINFSVEKGEFIAIMGESGSGKTTLLNMVSTLDKPTEGNVIINGKDITTLKESQIARFRRNELGFVFQDFNLLDSFSNRDNIYLPLVLSDVNYKEMDKRIDEIKGILGIEAILEKYPYEVSGGQKQRVAIARAIITKPSILLADEPTGALDSSSSQNIMELFESINKNGQTVLMVTHSLRSAAYAKRVMFIKDGIVFHEIYRAKDESVNNFMEKISQAQSVLNRRDV
ncbi:MAG: ABC transporter ATP-binding protein YxdL [Peptostreptococcus russellii]|uniref:Bacteriocin ABC transporter ATP-binding protein n=1 Tax=Peptostreptococcus russellii TaxID=215200 RepID=A0A2P7PYK7_9FIRM|nr:ABC transporter ATP-binding protein [Peptostreptococcus russellii]PSJ30788.1 bacteriocin ABC transporter ATP-binding protein [Peptostreptococcus russellii]